MKVERIALDNFMIFNELNLNFSPNINVISGENSTGKTALIKILYTCLKAQVDAHTAKSGFTKERLEEILVRKMQGVFRPDQDVIGRLVNRRRGSNRTDIDVIFDKDNRLAFGFGNRQGKHIDIQEHVSAHSDQPVGVKVTSPIYIPPKEIISSTENFVSLYDDYHIAFEETYYDLARLLERPLKKGKNTNEPSKVLQSFEEIVNGSIVQKDKKFYLNVKGSGEFEMGLVSEGYRKLSTVIYLIASGSLTKHAVLFWDEPETNMNPKMIKPMADAIICLAQMGVQIFITTHDYFVQQSFNLAAEYQDKSKSPLVYQFMSLYPENGGVACETAAGLSDLSHNAIMEEFDQVYDREQEMIYGH